MSFRTTENRTSSKYTIFEDHFNFFLKTKQTNPYYFIDKTLQK